MRNLLALVERDSQGIGQEIAPNVDALVCVSSGSPATLILSLH